jgi:hypothetical protein
VLHTLIDVAAGLQAHLAAPEARLLHEAVDKALNDSTALDGPDTAPEPGDYPPPIAPEPLPAPEPVPADPSAPAPAF